MRKTRAKRVCRGWTPILAEIIKHVSLHSGFYGSKLATLGLQLSAVGSAGDIARSLLTARDELQRSNWDFLCVPRSELVEIVETSGTTGWPVYIGLTKGDLERIRKGQRASFECAGITPNDGVHISLTLDNLFNAGMAYHRDIQEIGAAAVRVGPHGAARHIRLIQDLKPTVIVAVPGFVLLLASRVRDVGVEVSGLGIKKRILVGETTREMTLV